MAEASVVKPNRPVVGKTSKGFVFGEVEDTGPKQILGALPLETYLVYYTDHRGEKCTRLVFKVAGKDSAFVLQEKVQGEYVANGATGWFADALKKKLEEVSSKGKPEAESI
jgi:hypothetical protein